LEFEVGNKALTLIDEADFFLFEDTARLQIIMKKGKVICFSATGT